MTQLAYLLSGERQLEEADQVLDLWASVLAMSDRDSEAGEVLRVRGALMELRCSFLDSEKQP